MRRQKGMGVIATLMTLVVAIFIAIVALKVVPAYLEYVSIKKALGKAVASSEVPGGSAQEIRGAFDKQATIDDIKSVRGQDLEIIQEGSTTVVRANYTQKVPLLANVSLLIDFSASTVK